METDPCAASSPAGGAALGRMHAFGLRPLRVMESNGVRRDRQDGKLRGVEPIARCLGKESDSHHRMRKKLLGIAVGAAVLAAAGAFFFSLIRRGVHDEAGPHNVSQDGSVAPEAEDSPDVDFVLLPSGSDLSGLVPYLESQRVIELEDEVFEELLLRRSLPIEMDCLSSCRFQPWVPLPLCMIPARSFCVLSSGSPATAFDFLFFPAIPSWGSMTAECCCRAHSR